LSPAPSTQNSARSFHDGFNAFDVLPFLFPIAFDNLLATCLRRFRNGWRYGIGRGEILQCFDQPNVRRPVVRQPLGASPLEQRNPQRFLDRQLPTEQLIDEKIQRELVRRLAGEFFVADSEGDWHSSSFGRKGDGACVPFS
jgi:hypothetical protein